MGAEKSKGNSFFCPHISASSASSAVNTSAPFIRRPVGTALLAVAVALAGMASALLSLTSVVKAQTNSFPEFQVENAREYLGSVSQAVWAEMGTNAQTCLMQARLQSQLGRKDLAERLARQGLSLDPSRADIEIFLADLFIRQDRLQDAAQDLRRATQLEPGIKGGYRRLGMVLDRLGDRPGAEDAFNAATRLVPEDATARLLLGRLLLDQGQFREAIAQLERATQLDPGMANAYYALSQAQNQAGQQQASKKTLETFQQLKRKEKTAMDKENSAYDNDQTMRAFTASFHSGAASLLARQGKAALAEAHLRQAIQVAPQEPQGYEMLGEFYIKQDRLSQARQVFLDLVRLWPEQVAYRINLSTLLLQLKEYPAAVKELKRILELDPKQPIALNNLTRFYLSTRHELPEALALSQRLAACEPNAANYDLLSWAFYANGRTNEALATIAKAVDKEPNNAVYRERYQRLQKTAGGNQ